MLLIESQYFPNIAWLQHFAAADEITIEHFDFYQKQSLRNRCHILGAEKTITLSVPLLGGRNQKTVMKDLKIDYTERWQQDHRKTIQSCYAKSPFYEYYVDTIFDLINKPHVFLIDLNLSIIQQFAKWIRTTGNVNVSEAYVENSYLPKNTNDQRTTTHTSSQNEPYIQVFDDRMPFKSGLSCIDALFCLGPSLNNYLRFPPAKIENK